MARPKTTKAMLAFLSFVALPGIPAAGHAQELDSRLAAAEDFVHYANEVPGFYWRLGVVAPGTTSGALHTPTFRADDSAIPVGIRVMSSLIVEVLQGGAENGAPGGQQEEGS